MLLDEGTEVSERYIETHTKEIIEALLMVMKSKRLRQSDLAELTGWTPSRVNKLIKGVQKVTPEDCRLVARALGGVIRYYPTENSGSGGFKFKSKLSRVGDYVMAALDGKYEASMKNIMIYELPIAVMSFLQLDAADYIITTSTMEIKGAEKPDLRYGISVMFKRRNVFEDATAAEFGIIVSPYHDSVVFGIWLDDGDDEHLQQKIRYDFKRSVGVDENDIKVFNEFAQSNMEWIPLSRWECEIDSLIRYANDGISADSIESDLLNLFSEYCKLVSSVTGLNVTDVSPLESYHGFPAIDIVRGALQGALCLNDDVKQAVLTKRKGVCEIDESHESFPGKDGNKFMEVVPLIPLIPSAMQQYGIQLQTEMNAACLCPMCASRLVNGYPDDIEEMLVALYNRHKPEWKRKKFQISLTQFLLYHQQTSMGK